MSTPEPVACKNTDRELWREREGDYYAPSIFVTEGGGIGIDVGGSVIVKPVREWHKLAAAPPARGWREDIENAPRDGAVILSLWHDFPVLIAWVEYGPRTVRKSTGSWPFRKVTEETITRHEDTGWRVLMIHTRPDVGWGVHGNFAPFKPAAWMPLPLPPKPSEGG